MSTSHLVPGSDDAEAELLRLHLEAVWGVPLPHISGLNSVLPVDAPLPPWRLYLAEVAGVAIVGIWRADVSVAELQSLSQRAYDVLYLPGGVAAPEGTGREIVFRINAVPDVSALPVRELSFADQSLLEAYSSTAAIHFLNPARAPLCGAIVSGRLLSLAHSSRRTDRACELGIETRPEARRHGYALAATHLWTRRVAESGHIPFYSAHAENTASLALAAAAGYRQFARGVWVA